MSQSILTFGSSTISVPYEVDQLGYRCLNSDEVVVEGFACILLFRNPLAGHYGAVIYLHWDLSLAPDYLYEFVNKDAALKAWRDSLLGKNAILRFFQEGRNDEVLRIPGLLHMERLRGKPPWFYPRKKYGS